MPMIGSEIFDPGMQLPDGNLGFYPVLPAFFLAGEATLGSPKLRKRRFQIYRVRNVLAVTGSQEMLYSDIDANGRQCVVRDRLIRQFEADLEIPGVGFTGDRKGPDPGIIGERPVKADLYESNMLNPEPVFGKSDTVAMSGKLDAGKAIGWRETRIARFCSGFESPEKRGKCLI